MKRNCLFGLLVLCAVSVAHSNETDVVKLEGEYPGHLQDVWMTSNVVWWAHTQYLVKTDRKGVAMGSELDAAGDPVGAVNKGEERV